jgi:CHAT domain-containing protein
LPKKLQLEIIMLTAEKPPVRKIIPNVSQEDLLKQIKQFTNELEDPSKTNSKSYLPAAQQLYQWIIDPVAQELREQRIDNLAFSVDPGLRSVPFAALYDGRQFLIEQYSLSLIPSVNLVDTRYVNLKKSELQVLAMGLSEAVEDQQALPAVPAEIAGIFKDQSWTGASFLNQEVTLDNLKRQRELKPYGIIHLATHGEFKPGLRSNSFIQLWDAKLHLDQVRQLGWNNPPVELLVLSACRSALGDPKAELGFAGFAVQAGVKTAVASLWTVNDAATLGLMLEFYKQLKDAPIRAEALRQAQISLLKGTNQQGKNLTHPYYWAPFTMIGSPW